VSEISKHSALREFRLQLIKKIILKYGNQKRISIGRPTIDSPSHLSARHFRSLVSSTASKTAAQRKCYVWSHTKKMENRANIQDISAKNVMLDYAQLTVPKLIIP
jgi:hypothetical protein